MTELDICECSSWGVMVTIRVRVKVLVTVTVRVRVRVEHTSRDLAEIIRKCISLTSLTLRLNERKKKIRKKQTFFSIFKLY